MAREALGSDAEPRAVPVSNTCAGIAAISNTCVRWSHTQSASRPELLSERVEISGRRWQPLFRRT